MENIGQLNRRVEVYDVVSGPDANSYTKVRDQWMSITPIGANKLVFLSAQGSKTTHLIVAREKPAITVGQRLVYRGENYHVAAVQKFIGERQEIQAELLQ